MIYFDHNATTSIHPEVLDAMMPFLTWICAPIGAQRKFWQFTGLVLWFYVVFHAF